jgi:hypothetical protein
MGGFRSICTPLIPLRAPIMRLLTEANATVNSDAYCKCLVSRYSRGYYRPSEPPERMDQTFACSDYKLHLIGV